MTSPIQDISKRDTKNVIFAAYENLAKAYRALEKKSTALEKKGGQKALPPAPSSGAAAASAAPSGSLAQQLSGIGGHIGEHTSNLQQRLTAEAIALLEVNEHVQGLTAELARLYQIQAADGTLTTLIEDYEAKASANAETVTNKRDAARQALTDKRDAFNREKAARAAQIEEQTSERDKARAREQESYSYDREQRRKSESDEAEQAGKAFEAELADMREKQEAAWAAREQAISERETELAELESKTAGFDDAVSGARKKGESEGMGLARRASKTAAELAKKDTEGKTRVFELRIAGLEETLGKQATQIGALSKQLDTALGQAQDLAVKAIEGSSNSTSFDAIREIAMEQAKNSSKGK